MVARQMHMHVVCRKKKIQTAKLVNSGRSAEGQKRERREGALKNIWQSDESLRM